MDTSDKAGDALFTGSPGRTAPGTATGSTARRPRWFEPDSPIGRVHGDAAMFVGGLRAVLLQTLHPAAMTAVAEHSGYRGDMWGRLARTSRFLAVTTFGTADEPSRRSTSCARSTRA